MARSKRSTTEGTVISETSGIDSVISGIEDADNGNDTSSTIIESIELNKIQVDNKLVDENTVNIYELQFVGYAGNIKQYRSK